MDRRGYLDLTIYGDWQSARIEEVRGGAFVGTWLLVIQNHAVVVCKLVELFLVDKAEALVNEDVGVLRLVSPLVVNNLLHSRVVSILLNLCLPVLILATKSFLGDLLRVEMHHLCVIELVPFSIFIFALFSIFDECIVMASL